MFAAAGVEKKIPSLSVSVEKVLARSSAQVMKIS